MSLDELKTFRYCGIKYAAKQEDKHQETIRRWIRDGKLKAFKPIGSHEWVIDILSLPSRKNGNATS